MRTIQQVVEHRFPCNAILSLIRVGETDSAGGFELEKIVPGRYRLIAVEDGWDTDWRSAEFLRSVVGGGKELEIGAGAVVTAEVEATK
jgi:hypothetical protein